MELVFIDIDTQLDFINPSGALYVNGAADIVSNLKKLTEYGIKNDIPIISTQDTHTPDDPEFKDFPPHCVSGTHGHKKINETIVNDTLKVNVIDSEIILQYKYKNWCFLKTELDVFSHPLFERFIEKYINYTIVIYGVATEYCIRLVAKGLLDRKYSIILVEDAIRGVSEDAAEKTMKELKMNSALLRKTAEIIK